VRDFVWIAVAFFGWGLWTVVEKLALRNTTPFMVQLISTYVYSALAPVIYLAMKAKGVEFVWSAWGIIWVTVASLLAVTAGYGFLFAIQNRPVHQVMSFTQLYPILSFFLCWLFLDEQFTIQKIIGALLMVAGCALMNA
jgi:uncharacterized membrane protein